MRNIIRTLALVAIIPLAALSFAQKPHAKVTAVRAEKVAGAKYHGKVSGKTELENEDGKWQYAVMVKTGKTMREVMVDANTGRIASVEVVSAKEEAQEKAAETKHKTKPPKGH